MILLFLLSILTSPPGLFAQQSGNVTLSYDMIDDKGELVMWLKNWKYRAGDDPTWSQVEYDDADWDLANPTLDYDDLPAGGWSDHGWFRLHVLADSSVWGVPLGVGYHFACSAEVYLNGTQVFSIGKIQNDVGDIETPHAEGIFPLTLPAQQHSVISVRYASNRSADFFNRDHMAGFEIVVGELANLTATDLSRTIQQTSYRRFFTGLLLSFAFLHLLLYFYYPVALENLFYATLTGSFAALIFIIDTVSFVDDPDVVLSLMRVMGVSIVALGIFGLRFMYCLFYPRIPKQFWIFLAVGILLCADPWHIPLRFVYIFTFIALFEMLRTILLANYRKVEGALIIGVGSTVFILTIAYTLLLQVGVIEFTSDWQRYVYLFGTLGLLVSFSAYLARSFARTRRGLEKANLELEDYSRTLEDRVENRTQELNAKNSQLEETLQQLQETQNQLIMNEKMASLGNLVAGVAHEVNNPIGAVKSASDVSARCIDKIEGIISEVSASLKENTQFNKALGLLRDSNRITVTGSERIAKIVQSLKNFARLDEANFQEADIHEGLESTLTLIEHELKNRVTVTKSFGDVPRIQCYPNELNQVFMNLFVNAAHAIEGEGKIRIETDVENEKVRIRISDTGKGIPSEHLNQIFSPGFTTKGVGVGTGLGLSISYNIIQKHNGAIAAESKVGTGTTITITLPTNLNEHAA